MVNNSITFTGLDTHKDFFEVAYLEDSREAKPVSEDAEISKNRARYVFVAGYRLATMMTDEAVYLADGQQPGR